MNNPHARPDTHPDTHPVTRPAPHECCSASTARGGVRCAGHKPVFVGVPTCSARLHSGGIKGAAVLRDPYRPFYFGGAALAALSIPIWLSMWYRGYPAPSLPPLLWHAHEMVFGFAAAIIIGFLFTAAKHWTGLRLPVGTPLALLFGLWLGARVCMFLSYGVATAIVDSLLLVVVAGVLAHKFVRARSVGNLPLVGVLLTLAGANIAFHAGMLGLAQIPPLRAIEAGLMCVILVEMIIAGRVIPGFTASALPGVLQFRSVGLFRISIALAIAACAADVFQLSPALTASLAITAGVLTALQAIGWNPIAALANPMLWVLHGAYAWIALGLLLLGLAAIGAVPRSAAIHALAVGSMGGLIMGMITRTALGHSARPIRAGRWEVLAFALVLSAAGVRLAAALVPNLAIPLMLGAALAWAAAFGVYLFSYTPVLLRPSPAPR